MNCRQADIIGYSIFLEIFLEMLFSIAFGVPEKSVFTRLFCVFASAMLANFQDRLVMTASITLRKYDATACIIFTEPYEMRLSELLLDESASHTPPEDRQARLSGAGRGYLRRKAK